MSDDRPLLPDNPEAARLAMGWKIVCASDLQKKDPFHVARTLGILIRMLKEAEAPQIDMTGDITVLTATPSVAQATRGSSFRLSYNFSGGPTSIPLTVFVHFHDETGKPVFQDDHDPPTKSSSWSGRTSYSRDITVPNDTPPGTYRIGIGLYDRDGAQGRLTLETTSGVSSDGHGRYDIGTVTVS